MELPSVRSLITGGQYRDSPESFFAGFRHAWDAVRCQVLKLETRQAYQEPTSESWKALNAGDWDESIRLLEASRKTDNPLYARLAKEGVEFIRCRPIVFPATDYVRWEYRVYENNARQGERIFLMNRDILTEFFDATATHDFMVFDTRMACVHDYDDNGLIRGGWWIDRQDAIRALVAIHGVIKANCQPFDRYAKSLS